MYISFVLWVSMFCYLTKLIVKVPDSKSNMLKSFLSVNDGGCPLLAINNNNKQQIIIPIVTIIEKHKTDGLVRFEFTGLKLKPLALAVAKCKSPGTGSPCLTVILLHFNSQSVIVYREYF